MWYNRLSEYLIKDGYINNSIWPCVFIKKSVAILAVYVDYINLFGTPEELTKAATYLKDEFEMKDLGKTNIVLVYKSSISLMEFSYISQHMSKRY